MTYLEAFGKLCYEQYSKKAQEIDEEGLAGHALSWDELDDGTKECWMAGADAVANEFRQTASDLPYFLKEQAA